jgi:biotin carboxylase
MDERKHLLLVGGADPSLIKARRLGLDVTFFQLPKEITPAAIENSTRLVPMDYTDLPAAVSVAKALHGTHPVDATCSFTEFGLLTASTIGEALGVRCNPVRAVEVTRQKNRLRTLVHSAGLDMTQFKLCETYSQLCDFYRCVGAPIIVKPVSDTGSAGVSLVRNSRDMEDAWRHARADATVAVLAEEYIPGPEFSVEAMSFKGAHRVVAITEKVTTQEPHFVEIGHCLPARASEDDAATIKAFINALLKGVGHEIGPTHTEIKFTPTLGPRLIESHTRYGGGQIWEMVELTGGIDFASETFRALLFDKEPANAFPHTGAAIRFLFTEGWIPQAVSGLEDARLVQGVHRVHCTLGSMKSEGPLRSTDDRLGYVLTTAPTVAAACKIAELAAGMIVFHRRIP